MHRKFIRIIICLTIVTNFLCGKALACFPSPEPKTSTEYVLIYWHQGQELKAATLMSVGNNTMGIVAIPVYTKMEDESGYKTIAELFKHSGHEGLVKYMECRFHSPIRKYVGVEQRALVLASDTLGPFRMADSETTLLEVFEGTYTEKQIDLQEEIRSLAAGLVEPSMIMKVPSLIWIFKNHIKTNLGAGTIMALYRVVQGKGPEVLTKAALPGRDYYVGAQKYRDVYPEAWSKVLKDVEK